MFDLRTDGKMLSDGILLTVTTLALKTAGVMFSARLTAVAGAEAMGLSSQLSAVYAFAVTAAAAGVNLGTMRLTSESRGSGNEDEIRAGIACALSYCAKTGVAVSVLLMLLAPLLALRLIGNAECVLPLRILALAIPFISASGAFHGYFNGTRRVYKSAIVNVTEQAVRITLTLAGLYAISGTGARGGVLRALGDVMSAVIAWLSGGGDAVSGGAFFRGITAFSTAGLACLVVVLGSVASELCSCGLLAVLYLWDRRRYRRLSGAELAYVKRRSSAKFRRITVPMAVSAIIRTGLSSAEHLLLPRGLRMYGSENALAEYGIVCGMALPVILYPMALMNSFAQLNTVDIAARVSAGESRTQIRRRVSGGVGFALVYGIGCAAVLKAFAYPLGARLFGTNAAGEYISALSAFAVLSYLDHIADSMLKGLDCQSYVMRINILDSAMGVACALVLVPAMGIKGYILALYLCELLNCLCSLGKLMSVTGAYPHPIKALAAPAAVAVLSVKAFSGLPLKLAPGIALTASVYIALTFLISSAADAIKRMRKRRVSPA